jgi:toxin secretion/phage lysis holin
MEWQGVKAFLGVVGAAIAGLWGGLEMAVQVLVILMGVDILTGMLAALREGKLSSRSGWIGVTVRKATTLLIVSAATCAEPMLGGIDAGTYVAGFYCACEGLSVLENAGRSGVPVPKFLREGLTQLRDQTSNASKGTQSST